MANIKRAVTDQQRAVVNDIQLTNEGFVDDYEDEIEIPEFLKNRDTAIPTELYQMEQAILNNTPGNPDAERLNHLNELERACQNWEPEEWERVLYHADSKLMSDELKRRLVVYEDYMSNTRSNLETLTSQKL